MLIFTFWELGQESTWEHTFHTSDGCYSIVTSILDVITAMETGYALPIIMAPNPISDNQQTIINREWTASEPQKMLGRPGLYWVLITAL